MEDEKTEQRKWNSYKFEESLKENKYKTKSEGSFDNTEYPAESLNTDESPESATSSKNTLADLLNLIKIEANF